MNLVVSEKSFHYSASLARLWPLLSDSSLLCELDGQPAYVAVDELQSDGSVLRRAKGQFAIPIPAEWTEDLGEWVEQRYVRQLRCFTRGGFHHVDFLANMEPTADGCDVHIRIEMSPRGLVGWFGGTLGLMRRGAFGVLASMDQMIQQELALPVPRDQADTMQSTGFEPDPLPLNVRHRLDRALAVIAEQPGHGSLSGELDGFLCRTPGTWLQRIRPLTLARQWRADEGLVVALFLAAHEQGLLALRWEVLCPRCRNARDVPDNLGDLLKSVHCTTCNVDFEQDFSANVELTFRPEPWLRPLPEGAYCMMGAPSVPHIKVQRHVAPGERLEIDPPPMKPGAYRFRTTQAGGQVDVYWSGSGEFPSLLATANTILIGPPSVPGQILLHNQTDHKLTFAIEELAWRKDALTGDRAIVMPAFQQFCPEQILRPGDDVAIANVVLLFTDLKGSTSLYEALGDGAAYNLVRDHFDYLTALIQRRGGVLVKTIGDAVMAAFAEPEEGVQAAVEAQLGIADFNQGRVDGGIVLKVGLHQGPCIAVTTGQQLDYFGSTVNVAARVQGENAGDDIVLSNDLFLAAGVGQALSNAGVGAPVGETVELHGVARAVQL